MHGAFYASLRLDAIRRRAAITYRAECGLHAALRADAMHGCAMIAAVRQGSAICFLTVLAVLTINLKAKIPRRRAFWGLVGAVFSSQKCELRHTGAVFLRFSLNLKSVSASASGSPTRRCPASSSTSRL